MNILKLLKDNKVSMLDNLDVIFQEVSENINKTTARKLDELEIDTTKQLKKVKLYADNELNLAPIDIHKKNCDMDTAGRGIEQRCSTCHEKIRFP